MFVQDPMTYLEMKVHCRTGLPLGNNNLLIRMVYKLRLMCPMFLKNHLYHPYLMFLKNRLYHPYLKFLKFLKNHLYHPYLKFLKFLKFLKNHLFHPYLKYR